LLIWNYQNLSISYLRKSSIISKSLAEYDENMKLIFLAKYFGWILALQLSDSW